MREKTNVSASDISLETATRIAIECGAIWCGTYMAGVDNNLRFSTHFFNKEEREIGYYLHDLQSYNDTRGWSSDGVEGRIYADCYKQLLRFVKRLASKKE